jgi:hypothetical protein
MYTAAFENKIGIPLRFQKSAVENPPNIIASELGKSEEVLTLFSKSNKNIYILFLTHHQSTKKIKNGQPIIKSTDLDSKTKNVNNKSRETVPLLRQISRKFLSGSYRQSLTNGHEVPKGIGDPVTNCTGKEFICCLLPEGCLHSLKIGQSVLNNCVYLALLPDAVG